MVAKSKSALLGILFLAGVCAPAAAADLYEPPVVPAPVYQPVQTGGWYIGRDIDYHWSKLRAADYVTFPDPSVPAPPGCGAGCTDGSLQDFVSTHLKGAWSIGGGVGYQIN